jgi:acyl-CoA thioester hydrolase
MTFLFFHFSLFKHLLHISSPLTLYLIKTMFTHDTQLRVRYAETDQMGFVYYGRYMEYLEVGRVEMMRARGIPYRLVEEKRIWMPVSHVELKYRAPGRYDELLTIRTHIRTMPRATLDFEFHL